MKIALFKRKRNIAVLEMDHEWIKIVQAELSAKQRKINQIIAEKTVSSSDDKVVEQIINLFKKMEIHPEKLVISVAHQLAAIKNIELPSTNPAEIKDMVRLQIGKQTPFTKDEIIYDYEILATNAEGYSRVMLAIVHQDVVRWNFKILQGARLKTERVALSSEGLLSWSRFACAQEGVDKPYVLIEVNYDKSDFTVIFKDKLIFCRSISLTPPSSEDKIDEWQSKFIEEVNHSVYAYQNEMIGKEISKIMITGAERLTGSLNETVLKTAFSLPVEIVSQLKNIPESLKSLDEYNVIAKDISIARLFGLALRYPEQKINLIPTELRIEKAVKERGKDLYLFGIYLVSILVITSSIFLGRIYNKECYLDQLKQKVLAVQEKVDELKLMAKETEVVKRRILTKNFSLNFIYEIHKVISPEIYLKSITFGGKDSLILRGTSSSMPAIIEFRKALETSVCFEDVDTKFATTSKIEGKELTDFEIICPLHKEFQEQIAENK